MAKALCSKDYCSSKGIYYYRVKLHTLNIIQAKHIPKTYQIWITTAAENDLTDAALNEALQTHQNSIILTPIKNKRVLNNR